MKYHHSINPLRLPALGISLLFLVSCFSRCNRGVKIDAAAEETASSIDTGLLRFISEIRAVDHHAHPNSIQTNDKDADALPLDALGDIVIPVRVRPESPIWMEAWKGLYEFSSDSLNETTKKEFEQKADSIMKVKGEGFPTWVLDRCHIEVMIANRLSMGAGLDNPRFRWVFYGDALLYPLSVKNEGETSDQKLLFPLVEQHRKEFLAERNLLRLPSTLGSYLRELVTPVLEDKKRGGSLAVKFEAAYLRSLQFGSADSTSAAKIYSRYANGGEPSRTDYRLLQDFLFTYIAKEAGRLGMAIHIHSYPGVGNHFAASGSDPILLEHVFNDPQLSQTKFVLVHGGGPFTDHTLAMISKPNVYMDISLLTQLWTPFQLSVALRNYLSQYPEKVLFGTDAVSFGPGMGWGLSAWIANESGRRALAMALTAMMRDQEISRQRAEELSVMVMRNNADALYHLGLQ